MKISVVIPMYNAQSIIMDCLRALSLQEELPEEVIIVDNNSTDSSVKIVKEAIDLLKPLNIILLFESKIGPGAARNKGVSLAKGEIIAFTDTDCIAFNSWVKNIRIAFEKEEGLDFIGGIHKNPSNILKDQTLTAMEKFQAVFWFFPDSMKKAYLTCEEDYIDNKFIVTFNCAFRKEFFNMIGGFDDSFRTGEDVDITLRTIKAKGKIIHLDTSISVYHKQNISLLGFVKKMFHYGDGLAHIAQVYFKHQIIIKFPNKIYHWNFKKGPTIFLLVSALKTFLLFFVLIIAGCFSLAAFLATFLIVILFLYLKIIRYVLKAGVVLSIQESLMIFFIYLCREIFELAGRIYWSFRYRVVCI